MKKSIKYIVSLIIVVIALYNSVYFQSLEKKLAEEKEVKFDAKAFVNDFWNKDLKPAFKNAINIKTLIAQLQENPQNTFKKEGQALGIGNIGYFKIKGEGKVLKVNENNVLLQADNLLIEIETEFIFGNAIRDASGLIKINDYDDTSNFNSISESINNKIREEVIPNFKTKVKKGNLVIFQGAFQLNKSHLNLDQLEVIPISLKIIN